MKHLDALIPQFKQWLLSLGASEYLPAFIDAGYDLKFIAMNGLAEDDLDCIGIPRGIKLGLRRKLIALYNLKDYYTMEEEDVSGEEDNEDAEEEEDEED